MIIGTGSIASIIEDRKGFIFFAGGESNRFELDHTRKEAEFTKIINLPKTEMIVYFSGLNIYYSDNEYAKHKLFMEATVKKHFENYCIFRIGSITWGDNPNTVINYFRHAIKNNLPFEIQDRYMYVNSKEEIQHWLKMIPETGKHEMNVTGKTYKVCEIVELIKNNEL